MLLVTVGKVRCARCGRTAVPCPAPSHSYRRSRSPSTGTVPPSAIDSAGSADQRMRHPATHGLPRDFHAVTLNDLLLPVQRQMVVPLAYDHLCQQTGSGRALFDRLGGLVAVFTVEAHAY